MQLLFGRHLPSSLKFPPPSSNSDFFFPNLPLTRSALRHSKIICAQGSHQAYLENSHTLQHIPSKAPFLGCARENLS